MRRLFGASSGSPNRRRMKPTPSPRQTASQGMSRSTSGIIVPCPPSTMRVRGASSRTRRAMCCAFLKLGTMKLIPTVS